MEEIEGEEETVNCRIATFNVENLFARYKFSELPADKHKKKQKVEKYFNLCQKKFYFFSEKKFTGLVVRKADPDVLCLQEVENLRVLERFRGDYLKGLGYKHCMLVESRDPRKISNGVISKYPIIKLWNHRDVMNKKNNSYLHSRDILDLEVDVKGHRLRIMNCHFVSMNRGRTVTHERRKEQAMFVSDLVDKNKKKNLIILGDFNDYNDKDSACFELVNHDKLSNVVERLPRKQQWTHYCRKHNCYQQLDYLLLSKDLVLKNPSVKPVIIRDGMPIRVEKYKGHRFNGIGMNYPKASDHCLLYCDVELCKEN